MVNYITIVDARAAKKGSIIAKVIGVGEVTSGSGDKGKWEKQIATLKDNSGTQQITLWNDDIGKLDQGQFIKLENPFWNTYKDVTQLSLGKFYIIHLANETDLIKSETPEESATLQTKETEKEIGEVYSETRTKIEASIKTILKIRKQIIETVNEFENNSHPGMVWEMTALIYSQYYGDNS